MELGLLTVLSAEAGERHRHTPSLNDLALGSRCCV